MPEIILAVGALALLMIGVFSGERERRRLSMAWRSLCWSARAAGCC
jgi:hypothetical protein